MSRASGGSKESRQKLANAKQTNKQTIEQTKMSDACVCDVHAEKPQRWKIINKFHLSNKLNAFRIGRWVWGQQKRKWSIEKS